MGDFNSNSPSLRGLEWRPSSVRQFSFDATSKGIAMRVKSGGAVTVSALDVYLSSIVGSPGVGVEILSSLDRAGIATTTVYPGTDTGATVAGWEDQANSTASNYVDVDDASNTADLLRNASTITSTGLALAFRGDQGSGLSGKRIASVKIRAYVKAFAAVYGLFNLGGTEYESPTGVSSLPGFWQTVTLWDAAVNPSTGLPWTLAEVNALIVTASATDEFGLKVYPFTYGSPTTIAAEAFQVASLWLEITTYTEDRVGYYYATAAPGSGWREFTLAGTAAMTANTWYWVHIFNWANASGSSYFQVPILKAPMLIEAASAASSTGDHRKVYETTISAAGQITGYTETAREMIPVLLDRSGTIETQSQPYCELDTVDVYSGSVTNFGTEITSAAGATSYGGLKVILGWQNSSQRPDAPLTFTIRRGAGHITGGGTLDVTFTLNPADLDTGDLQDVTVPISGFTTQAGATQYAVACTSTAANGKGWKVAVLDTRSDAVTSGVTAAEVQGASQGGTTDSYYTGGTENDRYDLPAAFVQAPAAPAGFTATPAAAA